MPCAVCSKHLRKVGPSDETIDKAGHSRCIFEHSKCSKMHLPCPALSRVLSPTCCSEVPFFAQRGPSNKAQKGTNKHSSLYNIEFFLIKLHARAPFFICDVFCPETTLKQRNSDSLHLDPLCLSTLHRPFISSSTPNSPALLVICFHKSAKTSLSSQVAACKIQ